MTDYHRTVPSAVLGEVMADIQTIRKEGWNGVHTVRRHSPFARDLKERFGNEVFNRYPFELYKVIEAQVKAEAPRVEKPKPKLKRTDARNNERRMRAAILRRAKPNGWTGVGVRELGREASMAHKTADDALARMVAEGQVERDRREDKHGNRHGFRIVREHPCWSEGETAQSLERLDASSQVEV